MTQEQTTSKTNPNEIGLPDITALVRFGKLGMRMMASRILSIISLLGVIALSGFVAYSPSWQGAACVGIVSFLVFIPSLKAESMRIDDDVQT